VIETEQIFLARRPSGFPSPDDFGRRTAPVPALRDGEVRVRNAYLSVDPYMRGLIDGVYHYVRQVDLGDTMFAGAVGTVEETRDPELPVGAVVEGYLGWQTVSVLPGSELRRVDPGLAPISTALGVLGMPGMTAYFGMSEIGRPRAGETVVVSAAAGAVGSAAGQIARIAGCRVVGIAGSPEKCRHLVEDLGFHAAIDYRATADVDAALREACPDRVDVYFDNVGGAIHDAVTMWMAEGCRIVICGQISTYNGEADVGPRNLKQFEMRRARMEGLRVLDYRSRFPEGIAQMVRWLRDGRLTYRESVAHGIRSTPQAFVDMLRGRNIGKQVVAL
jgi:NADPH-dependent curcumin reductase CurA